MHGLATCVPTTKEGGMKSVTMLTGLAAFLLLLLLAACTSATGPAPIDMGPIGDGLKVIGFALIGMSVVITVGIRYKHDTRDALAPAEHWCAREIECDALGRPVTQYLPEVTDRRLLQRLLSDACAALCERRCARDTLSALASDDNSLQFICHLGMMPINHASFFAFTVSNLATSCLSLLISGRFQTLVVHFPQ